MNVLAIGVPWHLLDTTVVAAFFIGMVVVVLWSMVKKKESSTDYFLAGKNASWVEIGSSIFASNIGSMIIISMMSKAPTEQQMRYSYRASTAAEKAATRASWNGWDILHTPIILGIIAAFYMYFW